MPDLLDSGASTESSQFSRKSVSDHDVDSFVITTENESGKDRESFSHKLHVADLVEQILEGKIDLESCAACNKLLAIELQKRIDEVEEDTQHYKTAIEAFGKDFEDDEDVDQVELELKELEKQEAEQRKRLESAMNEFKSYRNEATKLKSEVSELKDKEYELEKEYATLKARMFQAEEVSISTNLQNRALQAHVQRLKSTTPLAAAFHISRKGKFGVINGLRLGWSESEEVPWNEIAAAWGQTALLTVAVAKKLKMEKFERFTLVPLGEKSFIEDEKGNRHPLYTSRSVKSRVFGERGFDSGVSAYLDILCQIRDNMATSGITWPYKIEKGQIQKTSSSNQWYPVKFSFSSGDQWCEAMQLLLKNLKWARDCVYKQV
ncbi:unnamed protein product [Oikopleura dioica]|uniref:Atg6 BARA domain-containing protein n=1 Tax=Oikopleura dioica TaxID=34765 RepID=E4X415_OIKDI|nr:unnamed protein product [Oikopleura dioica]CBY36775.1 unnamed protein product [Oikopleura dioica]